MLGRLLLPTMGTENLIHPTIVSPPRRAAAGALLFAPRRSLLLTLVGGAIGYAVGLASFRRQELALGRDPKDVEPAIDVV